MDTKAAFEKFREWWLAEEQAELRLNFAEGWGFRVWLASRAAIEVDLDNVGYMQVEEGTFYLDEGSVEAVLTSHGIRIKGKTE